MKQLYLASMLLVLLCAQCQKPGNADEIIVIPTKTLLRDATANIAGTLMADTYSLLFCQYWSQHYNSDISRYQVTGTDFRHWAAPANYPALKNLKDIIRLCTEQPAPTRAWGDPDNQIAVARIIQVLQYQVMTDCWGDIPYSQALVDNIGTPVFDRQESIYRNFLTELEAATVQIKPGLPGPLGDVLYAGDMARWKKFANALSLRVAIRIADRDWANAKVVIEKAVAHGGFEGNADNANVVFSYINKNPLTEIFNGNIPYGVSATLTTMLESLEDPRLPFYASPASNTGLYTGKRYGLPTDENIAENPKDFSTPNANLLIAYATATLMDYAEQCFILAEAIERGAVLPGTAADWYHQGVRASLEKWGVDSAAIETYLKRPDVSYTTAAGSWREKIGRQKWLALYMQGAQAWSEWRRLDFGVLSPPPGLTFLPSRFPYPFEEQYVNKQNYLEAVNRMPGGDQVTSKVWWDVY